MAPSSLGTHRSETLALRIDPHAAATTASRYREAAERSQLTVSPEVVGIASLLATAYPALESTLMATPEIVSWLVRSGVKTARDPRAYRRSLASILAAQTAGSTDEEAFRRALRIFATREKLRVAYRELVPPAGTDVHVTARELSDLADVVTEAALAEALVWADVRFGVPTSLEGGRASIVVLGMGKLGGRELNSGSDIDLVVFYETDDGSVVKDGVPTELTLHEYFTRVTQRVVASIGDVTEDGLVFRVDMRLRPEGSRGALVNSLAAAERYYETWGRMWERTALVRARPIAGNVVFGVEVLRALSPFVWRRTVDLRLVDEMTALVARARAELSDDPDRDLKLGLGGIREAEFFVQCLQLIWGGRDASVRSANTLDALRRLRARGLVTDREGREMADDYLSLRRIEHRIQFATGLQTHSLPEPGDMLDRIARSLGYAETPAFELALAATRARVATAFASLRADLGPASGRVVAGLPIERLYLALDEMDEVRVAEWFEKRTGVPASHDLARHVIALSLRPDAPLGAATRERFQTFPGALIDALVDAADPEQAMRLLQAFFARLLTPSVYVKALAEDPRRTVRFASLLGASAFLGQAMVGHPELADRLVFGTGIPDATRVAKLVDEEVAALGDDAQDSDAFVGALRRAKALALLEVGLADLGGELRTREVTANLSALADATLVHATRFALAERGLSENSGLAVVAMGKLGGHELGYGSDLDIFFVYRAPPGDEDAAERFVRVAQRVLRLVSTPHDDGPGYELDTRLRPSGNQGLLVVSIDAFGRYHRTTPKSGAETQAADWERQALIRARAVAGDKALGLEVCAIAASVAYERGAAPAESIHALRMRMQRELAGEGLRFDRRRYDLKLGYGGLVDIEFAVQWLQMKFGRDTRVRTQVTLAALDALEAAGHVDVACASVLREGYRFLRRLEQRLRVLHGTSAHLIEEGAPGLVLLARRMGFRERPERSASEALLSEYRSVTREIRTAYLSVLGLAAESSSV